VEAGYLEAFVKIEVVPSIVFIGNQTRAGQIELLPKGSGNHAVDDIINDLSNLLESNGIAPVEMQELDAATTLEQETHSDKQNSTSSSEPITANSALSSRDSPAQPSATSPLPPVDNADPTARSAESSSRPSINSSRSSNRPWESFTSQPNTSSVPEPVSGSDSEPSIKASQESPSSKAKGKRRAIEPEVEPEVTPSNDPEHLSFASKAKQEHNAAHDWANLQRQRNLEARRERQRVLAQIEADKQARREANEARKHELADQKTNSSSSKLPRKNKSDGFHQTAHIQVRLLSGSTIRKSFPSSTPAAQLRPWIDKALRSEDETSVPAYQLKHLPGPPEPARPIDVGDEQHSLQDLDLAPSATLVLLPVKGSVDAYTTGSSWGLLDLPFAAVGLVAGAVGGAVGWLTGPNRASGTTDPGSKSNNETNGTSSSSDIANSSANRPTDGTTGRIRTMAEMRAEGDDSPTQLYNGNQVGRNP
jgi:hypothetical protein